MREMRKPVEELSVPVGKTAGESKVLKDRNFSREEDGTCVEKSRYCVLTARTVNRHRWMRRES